MVVTGGKGFLGRYLCQTLLRRRRVHGRPLDTLAILDAGADTQVGCDTAVQVFPNGPDQHSVHKGIQLQQFGGDITDKGLVAEALRPRVPGQQV